MTDSMPPKADAHDKYRHGRFRGFGPKCPLCGQPRSHGLHGNPAKRRAFPCLEDPELKEMAEKRFYELLDQGKLESAN